jgi:hypothetical protein
MGKVDVDGDLYQRKTLGFRFSIWVEDKIEKNIRFLEVIFVLAGERNKARRVLNAYLVRKRMMCF